MKTKVIKSCMLGLGLLFAQEVMSNPTISDVKATPIAPLGIAIDYNVSGATSDDFGRSFVVSFSGDNSLNIAKTLVGATNCVNGAHRVYWNMAKDGITLEEAEITVRVEYSVGVGALYCVIDLSSGSSADLYPVTYFDTLGMLATTHPRYWEPGLLVLKRVDAGTFIMGDDQTNESNRVTLTKPFYMGLFEVTQKQWELVMGTNVCDTTAYGKGNNYPVHYVSYDMIRGSSEGAKWPADNSVDSDSFLGKLRARTGLDFDLPTEAQWEYTCRAGTTTTYSYGDSANGDYMWYWDNSSSKTHEVGTKKANPWGFYDMYGNVWEWCLDRYNSSLAGGEDPKGSSSGSYRVLRGGSWYFDAFSCTSSDRSDNYPSNDDNFDGGFRISRTLP